VNILFKTGAKYPEERSDAGFGGRGARSPCLVTNQGTQSPKNSEAASRPA
jgi:hypothetical protein